MRMPTLAPSSRTRFTLVVVGALMLGACSSVDVTKPTAAKGTQQAVSPFVPTAAAKALIGVVDGTYTYTFDPTQHAAFNLGPNYLDIPANSVCDLVTSGYGSATWNSPCTPSTLPLTITVVIKNAAGVNPSLQFFPALRFNPVNPVNLYMYAPHVSPTDAKNWLMIYCSDVGGCVDESLTDASLVSNIDYVNNMVFRRIKHFSGYVVAENACDPTVTTCP